MANVLIIGAGGVGRVVVQKCLQTPQHFSKVNLASRSLAKCEKIKRDSPRDFESYQLNADDIGEVTDLINMVKPDLVINVALPYQNLSIMRACIQTKVHYLDTNIWEIPEENWSDTSDDHWYQPQWNLDQEFKQIGRTAILSMGFDPGTVNVFCAYAKKRLFDKIRRIDIVDVNAGKHDFPFATNFNPEINLREIQNTSHYWKNGKWHSVEPHSRSQIFHFPVIGQHKVYSMDHDEIHSLYKFFPEIEHLEFWMGFKKEDLDSLNILKSLGLLTNDLVEVETETGKPARISPLRFLKHLLPDPSTMECVGKTCIGCRIEGEFQGAEKKIFLYNVCDHQQAFKELGSQAVSYTTGVSAVTAAILLVSGVWNRIGVKNVEQFDPDPAMKLLPELGLKWQIRDENV